MPDIATRRRFLLFLVKPSHYDDEGYVIQWWKSALPSNSLACLFGIAQKCMEDQVLGEDVSIEIFPVDETNTRVRPDHIVRQIRDNGGFGMVGFVGVQSNQFPRVMDCARPLRAAGIPVVIGGFHVSGCLSMLPELPDSLKSALALGVSLYAGEAEGRFDEVLRDAAGGTLKPIYNYLHDLPGLEGATGPICRPSGGAHARHDLELRRRTGLSLPVLLLHHHQRAGSQVALSVSRRHRSIGAHQCRQWRALLFHHRRQSRPQSQLGIDLRPADRAAKGRDPFALHHPGRHGLPQDFPLHREGGSAGVKRVFIGLENIDPDNLASAKKKQNHISDYRELLLEWRKHRCITYCGYIIGFPNDTKESLVQRIQIIQRELPLDILEFFDPNAAARQRGSRQGGRQGRRYRPRPQQVRPRACDDRPSAHVARGMAGRLSPRLAYLLHPRAHQDRDPPRRGWRPCARTRSPTCSPGSGRASTSTTSTRSRPALSVGVIAETAGPECRSRIRLASTRATGAGRS